MLRRILVHSLDGGPKNTVVSHQLKHILKLFELPNCIPEFLQFPLVRRIKHKLRFWVDQHTVLEFAPAKHDTAQDVWILVQYSLYKIEISELRERKILCEAFSPKGPGLV